MEIMEISTKMQSINIQPSLQAVLSRGLTMGNPSPRVTRSKSTQSEESKKSEVPLPAVTRSRRRSSSENEVEQIYLNKKVKLIHKNLETIYEDPIEKKGNVLFIGTSKVKRSLFLDREFRITNKTKSKIRKLKIKRLGTKAVKCKISDEEFINKLESINKFINNEDCDEGNGNDSRNVEDKNRDEVESKVIDEEINEDEKIDEEKIHGDEEKIIIDEDKIHDNEERIIIDEEKIHEEEEKIHVDERIHEDEERIHVDEINEDEEKIIDKVKIHEDQEKFHIDKRKVFAEKICEEEEEILIDDEIITAF